jgi:ferrochelatase
MKKAVLLLNMGGAKNPETVEVFLSNMFRDKRILTLKSTFLRNLLAKLIVTLRKKEAKKNLMKVGGASPLFANTKKLLKKLNRFGNFEAVMRYTAPRADEVLKKLQKDKIEKLVLFPLYPQYSTTTTLSSFEEIFEIIGEMNWADVEISTIKPYYNNPDFLKIVAEAIKKNINNPQQKHLIFSAHSLPEKIINSGDPYLEQVQTQIKLLEKQLPKFKSISLAFQSKLGPVKWLEPALDKALEKFQGEEVVIYPISFTLDNIETNFELNIEYRELAEKIGIKDYQVISALNASDDFVKFIINITKNY